MFNLSGGWDAYKIYIAFKAHFNSDYNFLEYGGKTKASQESYEKRKDKSFFYKIYKKYGNDTVEYLLANFIKSPKGWIGDFNEMNYLEWKKTNQSLTYVFRSEMENLILEENLNNSNFDALFTCNFGTHPVLLKRFLSQDLHLETMVMLNQLLNYVPQFDKDISENIIWPESRTLIINYGLLLKIDFSKCKQILKTLL
jgi:hypothetical protein